MKEVRAPKGISPEGYKRGRRILTFLLPVTAAVIVGLLLVGLDKERLGYTILAIAAVIYLSIFLLLNKRGRRNILVLASAVGLYLLACWIWGNGWEGVLTVTLRLGGVAIVLFVLFIFVSRLMEKRFGYAENKGKAGDVNDY